MGGALYHRRCYGPLMSMYRVRDSAGTYISRQYTPISPLEQAGSFQVLIKVHAAYTPLFLTNRSLLLYTQVYRDGQMSRHVRLWREGDTTEWRGPFGGFTYIPNKVRTQLLMLATAQIYPLCPHSIAALGYWHVAQGLPPWSR